NPDTEQEVEDHQRGEADSVVALSRHHERKITMTKIGDERRDELPHRGRTEGACTEREKDSRRGEVKQRRKDADKTETQHAPGLDDRAVDAKFLAIDVSSQR